MASRSGRPTALAEAALNRGGERSAAAASASPHSSALATWAMLSATPEGERKTADVSLEARRTYNQIRGEWLRKEVFATRGDHAYSWLTAFVEQRLGATVTRLPRAPTTPAVVPNASSQPPQPPPRAAEADRQSVSISTACGVLIATTPRYLHAADGAFSQAQLLMRYFTRAVHQRRRDPDGDLDGGGQVSLLALGVAVACAVAAHCGSLEECCTLLRPELNYLTDVARAAIHGDDPELAEELAGLAGREFLHGLKTRCLPPPASVVTRRGKKAQRQRGNSSANRYPSVPSSRIGSSTTTFECTASTSTLLHALPVASAASLAPHTASSTATNRDTADGASARIDQRTLCSLPKLRRLAVSVTPRAAPVRGFSSVSFATGVNSPHEFDANTDTDLSGDELQPPPSGDQRRSTRGSRRQSGCKSGFVPPAAAVLSTPTAGDAAPAPRAPRLPMRLPIVGNMTSSSASNPPTTRARRAPSPDGELLSARPCGESAAARQWVHTVVTSATSLVFTGIAAGMTSHVLRSCTRHYGSNVHYKSRTVVDVLLVVAREHDCARLGPDVALAPWVAPNEPSPSISPRLRRCVGLGRDAHCIVVSSPVSGAPVTPMSRRRLLDVPSPIPVVPVLGTQNHSDSTDARRSTGRSVRSRSDSGFLRSSNPADRYREAGSEDDEDPATSPVGGASDRRISAAVADTEESTQHREGSSTKRRRGGESLSADEKATQACCAGGCIVA
jgi:hypothetical protein